MSHHAESPLARKYPQLDVADVHLFRGRTGTVLTQTLSPMSGPAGFDPQGLHEFNLDTTGRGGARDLVFRVTFGPAGPSGRQPLQLQVFTAGDDGRNWMRRRRTGEGELLASGLTETVIEGSHGIRIWAGRAADPFYVIVCGGRRLGEGQPVGSR